MGAIIAILVLLIVIAAVLVFSFNILGLIVTLIIAGLVGWLADAIIPGRIPYGWLGAIAAGLVGSWLGTLLLGSFGPVIAGIPIIPAIIGAIILAFVIDLLFKSGRRQTV
jgi:uncharacterized membrane protein YeaQ/YmgE (transglycosylase-associated protein family)